MNVLKYIQKMAYVFLFMLKKTFSLTIC
jgi:hypothetical protein